MEPKSTFVHLTTIILLIIFLNLYTTVSSETLLYKRCRPGFTLNGAEIGSKVAHSEMDCGRLCDKTSGCKAVTVCPVGQTGDPARAHCTFLSDYSPAQCQGLEKITEPECYFMQTVCQNGGTPVDNTKCACPPQYAGQYCERYIRDCAESFQNGHQKRSLDGPYLIQPVNSPHPFWAYCVFDWGGVTHLLRRHENWNESLNWTKAKAGFGEDRRPDMLNYFAGLENLHTFTNQAFYTVQLFLWSDTTLYASVFYDNLVVGPEADGYPLNYTNFYPGDDTPNAQNGLFKDSSPLRFVTPDNDPNSCGNPGWCSASCDQHSLFAQVMDWPVSGTLETVVGVFMVMNRNGDFY